MRPDVEGIEARLKAAIGDWGFPFDDVKFLAQVKKDIPALCRYVLALERVAEAAKVTKALHDLVERQMAGRETRPSTLHCDCALCSALDELKEAQDA